MNFIFNSLGILIALGASRLFPHPPNFTSLLALSFYVPALLGIRYLPVLLIAFVLTDLVIGFHDVSLFTWGSVALIGLGSKFFRENTLNRIFGSLLGAFLFFIITNFGVWTLGSYTYTLEGFLLCYTLAIPFFSYTLISTFIFSGTIEVIYKFNFLKLKFNEYKNTNRK